MIPWMSLSLLVLYIGGLLIYLLRGRLEHSAGKIAVGFSFVSVLLMMGPFWKIFTTGEVSGEYLGWSSILGAFGLHLDGVAFPITFAMLES